MNDDRLTRALGRALLALRITLGLFLLQWGVEKFLVPASSAGIWQHFYGLTVPSALGYLFGAVEIAIAGCLFLGVFRTPAYGGELAPAGRSLGRSGEPPVHRGSTGAGRVRRALPAAPLGPGDPGSVAGPHRGTFARSSSNQFSTTLICGRSRSGGSLSIRNRSPSRETS